MLLPAVSAARLTKPELGQGPHCPAAAKELETVASCTWPLNPHALGVHYFAPKEILSGDSFVGIATITFVIFGAAFMYADACEMLHDDEEETEKMQPRRDAHTSLGPSLPASCSIVALALAIAMKIANTPAPTVCIRATVLSAPEGPLTLMDGVAMAELLALPGVGHQHTHLALVGDRAAIVFLLAFGLLAMAAASIDFWEMLAEQEEEVPASCDDVARSSASTAMQDAVKSTEKQEQCLSYVSLTWRLVSCLVLLLSVVGAAVAALCDTAI